MSSGMYFRRRKLGPQPRVREVISDDTKNSLRAIIDYEVLRYSGDPEYCPTCKCRTILYLDLDYLRYLVDRDIPNMEWSSAGRTFVSADPSTFLDLIECCFSLMSSSGFSKCESGEYECLREALVENLRFEINRVFVRDGVAYELNRDGKIVRMGVPFVSDNIQEAIFSTGDETLDGLMNTARSKFIGRDQVARKEGLEKLWDAWERLKTLEEGSDKKATVAAMLDRAAIGPMPDVLETEARELTKIGNEDLMIRHTETDKHPVDDDRHVDYLFHRMFSLIYLLLDATGRVGSSK